MILRQKLSSVAIYSAIKLGIDELLIKWLENDEISYNVSLALGLLGKKEALLQIRKRIAEHPLMDTSESRDDLLEDLSAIYLAAKFGDKESVKKLLKYLK